MNPARLAEVEAVARQILASHFAAADAQMTRQEGGLSNYVFEATTAAGTIVLRLGPADDRTERFTRERCVIARVRTARIPAPEVIAEGHAGEWAFIAFRRMGGEPATYHPKRIDVLRQVARLAATGIHRIKTIGFGQDFALPGLCSGADIGWRQWLEQEFGAAGRIDFLRRQGIISNDQFAHFCLTLDLIAKSREPSILNHGDLRLKNVLIDPDGQIVGLVDWENCLSAAGPAWDLSIALHDLNIDEKDAFLEAYGMSGGAVGALAPTLRLLNALNYVNEVRTCLERGDTKALERIRNRFSGALDLFAGYIPGWRSRAALPILIACPGSPSPRVRARRFAICSRSCAIAAASSASGRRSPCS